MACAMLFSASYALLREDKYEEFLASVPETLAKLRDLNSKELEVLLPTSFKLLSDEEFVRMSKMTMKSAMLLLTHQVYMSCPVLTIPQPH